LQKELYTEKKKQTENKNIIPLMAEQMPDTSRRAFLKKLGWETKVHIR
jgi:hypothetical protein